MLELPAMLHGLVGTVRREVEVRGKGWARDYLKTGSFTAPQRMLQVPPGESLEMISGAQFDGSPRPRWRVHMFVNVFRALNENVPEEEYLRVREAFEAFCLSTPWGALYHAVSPPPLRSAERMARRLAALLRFWDVLQGPRYLYRVPDTHHTLDELMDSIYRETLEAWCPGGPVSVREHMALVVERMAHATREECVEAVLRVIPALLRASTDLKHRDVLSEPAFLHERLATLSSKDFEDVSGAYVYAVSGPLHAWDRALGRH